MKQRLLTPGPTAVPPRVLEEMARPLIHHRTAAFRSIFKTLCEQLQQIFGTTGPVLSITGSGTTAFEAAQVSLAKPGSKVITVAGGKFGERWQDIYDTYADALGISQIKINTSWGQPAPVEQVERALHDNCDVSVVTVVHSETSTATVSDVKTIASLCARTEALLIADGITSVGALPVEQDAWGIDVLVSGSQKAMMVPPGLGYVGLGRRAIERLDEIAAGPSYNLDLRWWLQSWRSQDLPFTPPVSLIRAQKVACDLILERGMTSVIDRTRRLAEGTREALASLGLKPISSCPSDSVSGAFYPEGVDDAKFRSDLTDRHGIHLSGGQDGRGAQWTGKVLRISHMGFVDGEDTRAALAAIETELASAGIDVKAGAAVEAFNRTCGPDSSESSGRR